MVCLKIRLMVYSLNRSFHMALQTGQQLNKSTPNIRYFAKTNNDAVAPIPRGRLVASTSVADRVILVSWYPGIKGNNLKTPSAIPSHVCPSSFLLVSLSGEATSMTGHKTIQS